MITPDTPLTTDLQATIAALPFAQLIDFIRNEKAFPEARRYAVRVLNEAYKAHPLLAAKQRNDPELAGLLRSASDSKGRI